jgi:DNA polymerase-1
MASRPMFYLIDGHAVAYRQFFGLQSNSRGFTTQSGEQTNAVFGFTRTLLDILQKDRPQYLAVSFDMGLSGRDQLYEAYKGTREKMPDELTPQIERIRQLTQAFNIPVLAVEDYEADDVIGSIVPQAEAQGVDIRIITGDRDILQLLSPHITVQLPKKGESDVVYNEALFREEYELEPSQLADLKGLEGDASDNIPGVRGVGRKIATTLLKQYGNIEGIYAHIDQFKGTLQQRLIEGEEMAYLSRQLATIRQDVPITLNLAACVSHDYDREQVLALFRELEFRQFTERLTQADRTDKHEDPPSPPPPAPAAPEPEAEDFAAPPAAVDIDVETTIVRDQPTLDALVQTLNAADCIVFDVESTSVDQMSARLVGIALAVNGHSGYYIPIGHRKEPQLFDMTGAGDQLPLETVIEALRPPLTNPAIPKYAHNANFDLVMMQRHGIDVSPITFDTMIAEWLLNPASKFLGLKAFANFRLRPPVIMTEITELIGTGRKQITMDRVDIDKAAPYAAADAAITHRAAVFLQRELQREPELVNLLDTLEMPLVPVIAAIERAGVLLDVPYLAELSKRLDTDLKALEQQIHDLSGGYGEFNINSPRQLNEVLFDKLGLSVEGLRKTTHGYTTDAATLEKLAEEQPHPILDHILNYRELGKLKGTYVDALPKLVNAETGRLHTSYNQTGTTTGRLSSSDPNLQNIPIRTEIGREVRRAFITAPGTQLLSVDYSQIELRVLAHMSGDPTLLEAFAQGQDIHAATAAAVYGIPLESVTYEQRSFAKRVNFGLIYGMGAFRLARDSALTIAEARSFIVTYFARLPRVQDYIEGTKQAARKGPIKTLFGRRRDFPTLRQANRSSNQVAVQAEERVAINMPIQGTAADIIKKAMIELHAALIQRRLRARMILQVHDELVLEVPDEELDEVTPLVIEIMENTCELKAPLKANAQAGMNWRDMDDIGRG